MSANPNLIGYEIPDAKQFPYDGGVRRVDVLDFNFQPPRVVRKAGWVKCMGCATNFFSQDVTRVRLCFPCKGRDD
jgi:hypothetical protein